MGVMDMLVRFTVENFLSFNNEQEFSMIPGRATSHDERLEQNDKLDVSLLKFCALYGANASGKSNLVKAFDMSRNIILYGLDDSPDKEWHFKLDHKKKNVATRFEYEVQLKDKVYAYGLEVIVHDKRVTKEWLYEINDDKQIPIFLRSISDEVNDAYIDYNEEFLKLTKEKEIEEFEFLIRRVNDLEMETLVSEISRGKSDFIKKFKVIYDLKVWLEKELIIVHPNEAYPGPPILFNEFEYMLELLKKFDTGITNIKLEEKSEKKALEGYSKSLINRVKSQLKRNVDQDEKIVIVGSDSLEIASIDDKGDVKFYEIMFNHHNIETAWFSFGEESDGTKRIIQLIGLFNDLDKNKTIIMDELDRSWHPKLTVEFVKEFLERSKYKGSYCQLIITTHESALMDLDILRRDEIWFVERNRETGSSELFSLEDFKPHRSTRIEKNYLFGRYGAIPVFTQCGYDKENKHE